MPEATHQLAAIMFTDIVGYTTLMGEDEQSAIRLLDKNLSIQKPLIEQHKGKLLKEIGDGLLSSFNSVIEAVKCAIEIQDKLKDDPELNISVGIHLGDVLFRDGDVLGDGVNISSRIESLASSGEILVSEAVYNNIKNQERIHTKFLKEETLKNVVEPVRIYKVSAAIQEQDKSSDSARPQNPTVSQPEFKPHRKKIYTGIALLLVLGAIIYLFGLNSNEIETLASEISIGIIPFRNNTGDTELNHYGVGLASEVRTELSLTKQFDFISSMQATIRYQNSNDDPKKIGNDLGVTHIVSGMYQLADNNIHVIVEMVEAVSGKMVWSLSYQTQYEDLFSLQANIAEEVMKKFAVKRIQRDVPTLNMEAFSLLAKGDELRRASIMEEDKIKALPYYKKAIQLDSGYLEAWRGVIQVMSYYYFNFSRDTLFTPEKIRPYYEYVESNFPDSWMKNEIRGIYAYWVNGDYQLGLRYFEDVLKENPLSTTALGLSGALYGRIMQFDKSLKNKALSLKISPIEVSNWSELGIVFWYNGDYKNTEIAMKKMVELNSQNSNFLYYIKRITNTLDELPEIVKVQRGKIYEADLLYLGRNFEELSVFLDTVGLDSTFNTASFNYFKSLYHYHLKQDDSARYYANQFRSNVENEFRLIPALGNWEMSSLNGRKPEFTENKWVDEDLARQWQRKRILVIYEAINGNYKDAGELLLVMNREYPQIGDYGFLNLPYFDRIKEENPTFQDIVNNLRLPLKLSEENPLKM